MKELKPIIYGYFSPFIRLEIIFIDNASIHKCKALMEWLSENKMSVIEWPGSSPDINLIENIWKMLSDAVYDQKQFQKKDDLWLATQNATEVLMETKRDIITEWFVLFNRRLFSLISAKGLHIPY